MEKDVKEVKKSVGLFTDDHGKRSMMRLMSKRCNR